MAGLKGPGRIEISSRNNNLVWQEMPSHEANTQTRERPNDPTRPSLPKKGTSHKRWRCNPRQKEPKSARQDMHTHFQTSANVWNIKKVKHAYDPGITSLYPATMGKGEVMGEGTVWRWGEEWKPILVFLAQALLVGTVLLGWHATQKRQGWVRTIGCMPWETERERVHTGRVEKGTFIVWKPQVNGGSQNHWLGKWLAIGSHTRQKPLKG